MNKLMVNALYVGIAATLAMGLSACNREASAGAGASPTAGAAPTSMPGDNGAKYGRVVSVDPVRGSASDPQRVCRDEVVNHTAPPADQHQIAGMAIGAVAGGLLGNQVGGGKGRTLATVAGALGGGYAGKKIEESHQQGRVTSTVEHHCSTVNKGDPNKIVAYDVRYEYNGVTRTVRMDHDPGDRVQVQEGVVSVSDAR
ncbi:glycine zipper 2TM domain-containing protein [Dyella tabacisoli]|uniref:Glycine zipper 2TM domain-containing protein n=1 Tax=Dyella tabacisoli TaxID=2282381 RepID=A0A369ULJ4_9GAMM|nr:glycine zipper 2TM domain-containing protein [Dyella tabacisoli]RDD81377.1 glycine zipper 2TM domain-containing protein [Dyella tabacisoli]